MHRRRYKNTITHVINENEEKRALFLKGTKSSHTLTQLLKELALLKKPFIKQLTKKNDTLPFESPTTIEFLANKNECSLFAFGNHSKKRPNNVILGRLFDYHILDMIEFGVENFQSCYEFESNKVATGSKPCFLFVGEEWQQKEEFKKLANLLLDFYKGSKADQVNLAGLEYVFVCTSTEGKVYFRTYKILLKKSGTRIPRIELEEMGPSFDMIIRRHQFASSELNKLAYAIPKELRPKKVKNIETDEFVTTGTLHIPRQDLSTMATKKMKGLNKRER